MDETRKKPSRGRPVHGIRLHRLLAGLRAPGCAGHRHGCRARRWRSPKNTEALGLADRVAVLQCSLGSGIGEKRMGTFDAVVSNPPYVPTAVMGWHSARGGRFRADARPNGGADGLDLFQPLAQWTAGP